MSYAVDIGFSSSKSSRYVCSHSQACIASATYDACALFVVHAHVYAFVIALAHARDNQLLHSIVVLRQMALYCAQNTQRKLTLTTIYSVVDKAIVYIIIVSLESVHVAS